MLHTYDHWKTTNPDDEFLGPEPQEDEDEFYVGCGSFKTPADDSEYYIARKDDGTVVARGLLEDSAYALCAQMNAGEEEELPEPTIDEEWNASRGEYETVVTFASGTKFAVRQVPHWDTWEVNGPDFYMDFTTREQALNYLTDDEFARTA